MRNAESAHRTAGSILGTTVADIVNFLAHSHEPNVSTVRRVRALLSPIADSVATMRGIDASIISIGIAACRVASIQRKLLPEMHMPLRVQPQKQRPDAIVGVCASLFVCMSALLQQEASLAMIWFESDFVINQFTRSREMILHMQKFLSADCTRGFQVEQQLLERALLGVAQASKHAAAVGSSPLETVRLQLEWARLCGWPRHENIDVDTPSELIHKIKNNEFALFMPPPPQNGQSSNRIGVVPLSALKDVQPKDANSWRDDSSITSSLSSSLWSSVDSSGVSGA